MSYLDRPCRALALIRDIAIYRYTYVLQHEKTCLLTCAPGEDSNQSAHPRNLITIARMKKLCILAVKNVLRETSDKTV